LGALIGGAREGLIECLRQWQQQGVDVIIVCHGTGGRAFGAVQDWAESTAINNTTIMTEEQYEDFNPEHEMLQIILGAGDIVAPAGPGISFDGYPNESNILPVKIRRSWPIYRLKRGKVASYSGSEDKVKKWLSGVEIVGNYTDSMIQIANTIKQLKKQNRGDEETIIKSKQEKIYKALPPVTIPMMRGYYAGTYLVLQDYSTQGHPHIVLLKGEERIRTMRHCVLRDYGIIVVKPNENERIIKLRLNHANDSIPLDYSEAGTDDIIRSISELPRSTTVQPVDFNTALARDIGEELMLRIKRHAQNITMSGEVCQSPCLIVIGATLTNQRLLQNNKMNDWEKFAFVQNADELSLMSGLGARADISAETLLSTHIKPILEKSNLIIIVDTVRAPENTTEPIWRKLIDQMEENVLNFRKIDGKNKEKTPSFVGYRIGQRALKVFRANESRINSIASVIPIHRSLPIEWRLVDRETIIKDTWLNMDAINCETMAKRLPWAINGISKVKQMTDRYVLGLEPTLAASKLLTHVKENINEWRAPTNPLNCMAKFMLTVKYYWLKLTESVICEKKEIEGEKSWLQIGACIGFVILTEVLKRVFSIDEIVPKAVTHVFVMIMYMALAIVTATSLEATEPATRTTAIALSNIVATGALWDLVPESMAWEKFYESALTLYTIHLATITTVMNGRKTAQVMVDSQDAKILKRATIKEVIDCVANIANTIGAMLRRTKESISEVITTRFASMTPEF
jgi:hypothetical protein